MAKKVKTNAMRLLNSRSIPYDYKTYSTKDGHNDGISVANKVGEPLENVFKTLVLISGQKNIYVCMVPVDEQLSLKKAATCLNEKTLDLLPLKKLRSKTGYVKGGCSPIAMTHEYPTIIHESVLELEYLVFSAGKVGVQLKMKLSDFKKVIDVHIENIIQ